MKKVSPKKQAKLTKAQQKRAGYTKKRELAKKALVTEQHIANKRKNEQAFERSN